MNKDSLYESAAEYGALHNEDCCVNFPEDSRACDVGTGTLDCCDNMRMVQSIVDETVRRTVEYLSHDMKFDSEEQRKVAVQMYLGTYKGE